MGFWKRVLGKESLDDRIRRLWENAKKANNYRAVAIYTELLGLVGETSTSFNVCAILRNLAITYRSLKNYDAALTVLKHELEIAQEQDDQLRIMECQEIIEQTRTWKLHNL